MQEELMVDQHGNQVEGKEESVLQQWENMHRPPSTHCLIPPSGPLQMRRSSVISISKSSINNRVRRVHSRDSRRPSEMWLGESSSSLCNN